MTGGATNPYWQIQVMTTRNYPCDPWLLRAVELLRKDFDAIGAPIPHNIRVFSGQPGIAFIVDHIDLDTDGDIIIIAPTDPIGALEVLVHELVHVVTPHGHGDEFRIMSEAIGLKGKLTSTYASDPLLSRLRAIKKELDSNSRQSFWKFFLDFRFWI